ncbi:hypothetical protein Y032_0216g2374 [Ancylostoma ceylanicum]|uniref:Uncharacterized protein n=1 Tax=Ancylostoma ceylanicum TaxID=53326 RepID=A0A016SJW8_9BILA|nr:hypothetical protein Y032_0216g2374 [Ancylostoma ceylanicum]
MSDVKDIENQKNLILSALVAPSERKISRISLRKTSGLGEDYVDVVVDPFPALPINIRVPSLRKNPTDDTQSTTNIHRKKYTDEDRLKQWENLEVLPDTAASAALAQLALNRKESIKPDGAKKTFIPMKRNLQRTTSLDWSEKLFRVTKPKLRFTSQMNCQQLSLDVSDMDSAKEDLKIVSASLAKRKIGMQLKAEPPKEEPIVEEKLCQSVEQPPKEIEAVDSSIVPSPPITPTIEKPLMLSPEGGAQGSPMCSRKLTPMPRDLQPRHPPIRIRYALFEPLNWIYDSCRTDEEFDEKWNAVAEANHRFQQSIPHPKPAPISPPATQSGRRHSFDRSIGFAKRTINRTAHYFMQMLRDTACRP